MMGETKEFHIGDVLSITTGRLVSNRHMDGVYDILGWMSGESLFTHQLPRVSDEAALIILAMHPSLSEAQTDAEAITEDNLPNFLAKMIARYGETLPIPKMNEDQHERIDPMSELVEKIHPDRIVAVQI